MEPAPVTNEEIVRMVAAGRLEAEILRVISASAVDFDLDPEILTEMRRVGVSEKILSAMRERQALVGAPPPPTSALSAVRRGKVELTFAPTGKSAKQSVRPSFLMVRDYPRWAKDRLPLPATAEIEDLALFVACTTPDHVPDHWQDRTPLKDFLRHELLVFHAGSHPGKTKGFAVVFLDVPAILTVDLPAGDHRLVVGVAMKVGPDWHVAGSDGRDGVLIAQGRVTGIQVRLSARIAGSSRTGYKHEQDLTIAAVTPPEEGP